MAIKIGHASHDERGKYAGGKAGDQGGEVATRSWYSRPWTHVIRFKDSKMADKAATAMERACANTNIGYNQSKRNTALTLARSSSPKYDPADIKTKCDTDCSALVSLCCMYAGIPESALYKSGNSSITSNIRSRLVATGKVNVYTAAKYTKSDNYLKRGDILLYEGHHVAMALENGSKASTSTTTSSTSSSSDEVLFKVKVTSKSGANVRVAPGTDSKLCTSKELAPLKYEETVSVVGKGNAKTGTKLWYLIKKDGKRGYISSALVEKV